MLNKIEQIIKHCISRKAISSLLPAFTLVIFFIGFIFIAIQSVNAAVGIRQTINFQGKLVDDNGLNVADSSYSVVFTLYDASSGGTQLWQETRSVTTSDGIFREELGTSTSLSSVDFNDDSIYLGIKVGADSEMTPRVRFTATPYAFQARSVAWSGLQDAAANLAVSMGAYTSTFTYGNSTGANDLFNLTDTSSNTGTGRLLSVQSASGSTIKPFHVSAGGAEAILVDANGNVGIGTTNPTRKLDVNGTLRIRSQVYDYNNEVGTPGQVLSTTASGVDWIDASGVGTDNQTLANVYSQAGNDVQLAGAYGDIRFYRGTSTEMLFLDESSGNIGIGTTNPTYKLSVNGNVEIVSGSDLYSFGSVTLGNRTYTTPTYVGNGQTFTASIQALDDAVEGVASGVGGVWTRNSGSGYLFPATLSDSVGIGTSTPTAKLQVVGNIVGSTLSDGTISITGGSIAGATSIAVADGSQSAPSYTFSNDANTGFYRPATDSIGVGTSGVERIRVAPNGNVGIGTTNPIYKLDVTGDIRIANGSELYSFGSITLGNRTYTTPTYVASGQTFTASIQALDDAVEGVVSGSGGVWSRDSGSGYLFPQTITDSVGIGISAPTEKLHVVGNILATGNIVGSTLSDGTINITGGNITGAGNITAGGIITGTGSGLTGLNASNLASGTVPSARISGDYSGITGVGTITSGTWQGSVISSTYLDPAVILATEIDTSSEIAAIVGDETGSGALVFANTPTFAGNVYFPGSGVWNSSGNVGIGTTDPGSYKLNVNGTGYFGSTVTIGGSSDITSYGSTTLGNRTYTTPTYVASGQTFTASIQALDDAVEGVISGSGGVWSRDSGSGYLFPQTLTDSVGIGTSAPSEKLHVIGNAIISGNITSGGIITGTGSGLTGLNASNLASGTVPSARVSGNYSGITGVGTITSGTWQGSVISNTYLDPLVILSTEIDTSSELAGIVGDETGSGALVFANSPALVTPNIGAATGTSLNVTGAITSGGIITGTGSGLTALNASNLTTGTVPNGRIAGAYTNFSNVTGSGTAQFGTFSAGDGSRSAPAYTFTSDTNTGMYRIGNDILSFATAGADRFTILAGGNVGVGTTNPTYKLSVNGSLEIVNGSELYSYGSATLGNRTYTTPTYVASGQTFTASIQALDDAVEGVVSGSGGVWSRNAGLGYLYPQTITDSVGIGTSAPTAKLQVVGNIVGSTLSDGVLSITGGNITGAGNITSGGIITGTGSGLTGLNASNLASGTVPTARISGNYSGITGVGTITSGTWQGSVISNAYLDPLVILSTEIDTSSEIAAIVGDETGSGALVFANSPALVTPNIGAATGTSLNVTGAITSGGIITGTGSGLTALNASNLTTGTVPDGRITGAYTGFTNITGSGTVQFGTFSADNGSRTAPSYTFTSDTNMGMYRIGTDILSLATAGADRFTILAGGNVGIGTTSPSTKLEVNGQVKITGGSPGANKVLTSDASGLATWQTLGATSIADDSLDFDKFADAMTLDAKTIINQAGFDFGFQGTGSVGIGTTNPSEKLHVLGNAIVSGNITSGGIITGTGSGLTGLNASNLASGTVPSARVSGNYSGVTGVGTITSGTWQGSVISNTYLDPLVILSTEIDTYSELNGIVADVTLTHNGLIDTYNELNTIVSDVTLTHNGLIDTSSEIAAIVGDETGSGSLVFANTPTLVTPNIGAATGTSLNVTGAITAGGIITGTGSGLTGLNASNLASGTVPDARITGAYTGFTNITGSGTVQFGTFSADNGSRTAPSYTFTSDTNMGMYRIGTDILSLATAGADRFTILASGNVGVGTTNPGAKLEVNGQVKITGGSPGTNKVLTSDASGLATWQTLGAASIADDSLDFDKFKDVMLLDADTSVDQNGYDFSFFNTGNVGIGTSTPAHKLDVSGNGLISGNVYVGTTDVQLSRGAANRLDLATGDSFNIVSGNLQIAGTTAIDSSRNASFATSVTLGGDVVASRGAANRLDLASGDSLNLVSGDVQVGGTSVITSGRLVQTANGSRTAPAYSFSADTNTGMYRIGTDILSLATAGADRFTILANGSVGIGTTSPNAKLDVNGTFEFGTSRLLQYNDDNDGITKQGGSGGWAFGLVGAKGSAGADLGGFGAYGSSDTLNRYYIGEYSTNELISIEAGGDVGIGTIDPAYKLQIQGTGEGLAFMADAINQADSSNIRFMENTTSGFRMQYDGFIDGLRFKDQGTDLDIAYFGRDGNVGIGTTNPGTKLEIAGQIKITGGSPGSNKVLVSDSSGLASWTTLGEASITDDSLDFDKFKDNMTLDATTTIDLAGYNLGIHGTGSVGIGNSNPSQKLDVTGSALISSNIYVGTTDVQLSRGAANRLDLANGDSFNLVSGNLQVAGTTVVTSGRLVQTANGSRSGPAYSFSADTNTGMYRIGTDILGLATAGADRLTILANGSIGIGTTTPNDILDVAGTIDATGGYEVDDSTVIDGSGRYFYTQNTSVNKFGAANASGFGLDALNSGDWDLLVYEGQTYTENLKLGYGGTTSILSSYDTNEALTIRANGSGNINIMDSGTGDVNIDNNTLFVDNSTNRVGIGTNAPGSLLDLGVTGGLHLTNSELANVTDTTGELYFDENYFNSGEAGYPFLNGNGGGLAIKNEDGWGALVSTTNMQYLWMNLDRLHIGGTSDPGTNNLVVDGTITAGGAEVSTFKTNSASVTDGWYRIASDGPTSDGGTGGDTAYGRFVVWTYESGRHCQAEFTAGYDYSASATSPTVVLNSSNCYNGTDNPITAVRAVAGDTYEGAAVEVYIEVTTSASVGYQIYDEANASPSTNGNGAWTAVDWTAGSVWTGASATTINISAADAVMSMASGSGASDEFFINRGGSGSFGGSVTTNGDILNTAANGQLGASANFVFRDTGDSWLRLRTASGGSTYADLAVGNLNVAGNITGVQTLSFSDGANHRITSNASGLVFDGGDGTADFLVYDDNIFSDVLDLGYNGAATLTTYDTNENLIIDPNGTGMVAVGNGFTPTADVHIGGSTTTSDGTPDIPGVQIAGGTGGWGKLELAGGAANTSGHIDFIRYEDLGTDYSGRIISRSDGLRIGTSSEDNLTIADATGYVGIGGLASYPLDVTGNGRVRSNLYVGTSGNYLSSQPTGNYGSIQVNASGKGNWEGYSIDGRAVFMHDGATSTGIYNDVDNEWLLHATHNAESTMYYNGAGKISTTSTGVSVTGNTSTSGSFLGGTSTDSTRLMSLLTTMANGTYQYVTFGEANSTRNQAELSFYSAAAGSTNNRLNLGFYGLQVMSIEATGMVGIGTQDPSSALDVIGDIEVSGVIADSTDGYVNISDSLQTSGNFVVAANGYLEDDTTIGGNSDDWIKFSGYIEMKSNTDSYGIVLRDKDTTSYLGMTQVGGVSYLSDSAAYSSYFLSGNGANGTFRGNMYVGGGTSYYFNSAGLVNASHLRATSYLQVGATNNRGFYYYDGSNDLDIGGHNTQDGNIFMRDRSGNLRMQLNTDNIRGTLLLYGGPTHGWTHFGGNYADDQWLRVTTDGGSAYRSFAVGSFYSSTSFGAYGNHICSSSVGSGTYGSCSSSLRYKDNVEDNIAGLSDVMKMRPRKFDWKYNGQSDIGFIAEELEQINTDFVFYNDEGKVEGVRYDGLTGVLVNAIQEQQEQIASMSAGLNPSGELALTAADANYSVTNSENNTVLSNSFGAYSVISAYLNSGKIDTYDLSVKGKAEFANINVDDFSIGAKTLSQYIEDTVTTGQIFTTLDDQVTTQQTHIEQLDLQSNILSTSVASQSASLSLVTSRIDQLEQATNDTQAVITSLQDRIASLETMFANNMSTNSAMLFTDSPSATVSAGIARSISDTEVIFDKKLIAEDDVTVLGNLNTSDIGVTGTISSGLLTINGFNDEMATPSATISTLGGILSLQHDGMSGIDFVAGKVAIDVNGNVLVREGDVEIENGDLVLRKGSIKGSNSIRGIDVSVTPGATELNIIFTDINDTNTYAISVLPTWFTNVIVQEKTIDGFKILFDRPAPADAKIDWMIVE